MSKALFFWLIYIVCLVLYLVNAWDVITWHGVAAGPVEFFLLIGVLGWGVYGRPVQ
jgi:hypothetical protein